MSPWEDIDKLNRRITRVSVELHERMDEIEQEMRDRLAALPGQPPLKEDEKEDTAKWVRVATAVATIITALSLLITPIILALLGVGTK